MTSLIWTGVALLTMAAAAVSVPPDANVSIKTFKFRPDTIVVRASVAVIWTNEDEIDHTVTADSTSPGAQRVKLDGLLRGKGATYRASFTRPGVYAYHCERHQFMRGVVRVTSSGDTP